MKFWKFLALSVGIFMPTLAAAQTAVSPVVVTGAMTSGGPIYSAVGNGSAGSVPLPISGTVTVPNASVGANNATAPTFSTQVGCQDGSGKLQGSSATNPCPVTLITGSTTAVTQATGTNLHAVLDTTSTTAVTQPTAANLNATVVNAAGNALMGKVGIDQTAPGVTNGVQLTPQTRSSYRIIATAYPGYATPTDLFCLPGSPTKTVYISGFAMTAAATAATLETVSFIKRTTANTGGTASQPTITLLDSAEGNATTAGNLYSVIPAGLGTSGGLLGLVTAATGTLTAAPALYSIAGQIIIPNTGTVGLPITLRGTSEQACINWGGAALPSGFTGTIYIEWQEQ